MLKTPKTKTVKIKEYISTLRKIKSTIVSFDSNRTHIVSHGENLFDISKIYQTNMSRIISFNQIQNPSRIYPGMKLNIPRKKSTIVKFKEKIKPLKTVAISEEKKAKSYKDTSKPGNYLSKLNTFFPPTLKKKKNYIAKNLVDKIPSPLVNLTSYHLELKKYSPNHYLITIETEETLSHIADWAGIKTQTIRNLNNINFKANIHLGNQLKIRIPEKNINRFKELRNKYHLSIQEDFYNSYSITSIGKYIVKSGDSLSFILKKRSLPFWLLRKSQKDGKLNPNLSIGQIFQMPIIKASGEESSLIPPNSGSDING
jgi:membrane-bound lytic murein transglycosylase D